MNSEYFEPIKSKIKGKSSISKVGDSEFFIYDEKKESYLCISSFRVTYKNYTVPLNESELEDLYNMASMTYSIQEEKNKKSALDELKGDKK